MQIFFNFDQSPQPEPLSRRTVKASLRRAALKWLLDQDDSLKPAIGVDVPIRGSTLKADVAAAWLEATRTKLDDGKFATILTPRQTAVVICSPDRSDCWPQCQQAERLLREIAAIKSRIKKLEKSIRESEPELKEQAALFEEYAVWNYRASKNAEYKELLRQRDLCELTLFKGSRLTRICLAQAANLVYLAVPEGIMSPEEVNDSWGLLLVNPQTLSTTLAKPPLPLETASEVQSALAFSIADCATKHVAHCHGIRINDDKTTTLVRMPIIRRAPEDL